MKLFRSLSLALVLSFAGTAGVALADPKPAGSGAAPAPTLSDQDKADLAKFLTFFGSVVDAIVKDQDNCATMAADINKLVDDNQEIIKKATEAVKAGKQMDDASKKRMMEDVKRMVPAMQKQKCGEDKSVQAALMRVAPGKPAPKGR